METNGEACRIHISEQCKLELDALGSYIVQERGHIQVKGRGTTRTFWLCGRTLPDGRAVVIDSCDQNHPHLQPVHTARPSTLETPQASAPQQKSPRGGKSPNFLARGFLSSGKRHKDSDKKQEAFPVFKSKSRGHQNHLCTLEGQSV